MTAEALCVALHPPPFQAAGAKENIH